MKADEECSADAYAARLAGELREEIENTEIDELEEKYGNDGFRNRSYIRMAKLELLKTKHIPLERIRDKLNAVRLEKKLVPKGRLKVPKKR